MNTKATFSAVHNVTDRSYKHGLYRSLEYKPAACWMYHNEVRICPQWKSGILASFDIRNIAQESKHTQLSECTI